jgi:hypothetical protein
MMLTTHLQSILGLRMCEVLLPYPLWLPGVVLNHMDNITFASDLEE